MIRTIELHRVCQTDIRDCCRHDDDNSVLVHSCRPCDAYRSDTSGAV